MSQQGYIPMHREYFDSYLWKEHREFSRFEAWTDLCQRAAFRPQKQMVNGRLFDLGYGQLVASHRFLMVAWQWKSLSKVKKYLSDLEEIGEIEVTKVHNTSQVTVCKLACYYESKVNGKSTGSQREVNGKSTGSQIRIKKEDKEGNNSTTTKETAVVADEKIIAWFGQLKADQLFIEQVMRENRINAGQCEQLLKDFYRQKAALGELTHRRYTELRKHFMNWSRKHLAAAKNGTGANGGQGIQYPGSINLKIHQ